MQPYVLMRGLQRELLNVDDITAFTNRGNVVP